MTLACRTRGKTDEVIAEINRDTGSDKLDFVELDLGELASVRRCAAVLAAREAPIHCLINNAGLAGSRGLTRDGFELAFGTNHLGHYLLTRLLLGRLIATKARVVNVSSNAHLEANGIDWDAWSPCVVKQTTGSIRMAMLRVQGDASSRTCCSARSSGAVRLATAFTPTRFTPASSRPTCGGGFRVRSRGSRSGS